MKMPKQFIIAGIGTEIGKTLISAIFRQGLRADYWKPVQSGNPDEADALFIKQMTQVSEGQIWESSYLLTQPLSPHTAAEIDGLRISLNEIKLPATARPLIVELAGGILVPLNEKDTNLDLIKQLGFPVVLVSKNYLGSINHTLLSYEILKAHQIPIAGIVFNGPANPSGEKFILNHTGLKVLLRVPELNKIDPEIIQEYAKQIEL
jgi:dethiobiotin synthetase